jgi:hypothetical protein
MATDTTLSSEEVSLVGPWLKADPARWMAGIAGGALAGLIATGVACLLAKGSGLGAGFPMRLMATPIFGNAATQIGNSTATVAGFVVIEALAAFFGFVYAHFVRASTIGGLLSMGVVWALFSWVFIFNLFMPAFKPFFWAGIPQSATFLVTLVYGISLTSVGFFDQIFRGKAR